MDVWIPVTRSLLQQQDRDVAILAQPRGDDATGCPSADNDVVGHFTPTPSQKRAPERVRCPPAGPGALLKHTGLEVVPDLKPLIQRLLFLQDSHLAPEGGVGHKLHLAPVDHFLRQT
ncbi:MAG: hypothetical protein ACK5QX_05680, partial [bacterium]